MQAALSDDRPVRSLATTFVGPAEPEQPIQLDVQVLREGKGVTTLLGRAIQNGQVVTLVQGSFGAGRTSAVVVEAEPAVPFTALEHAQPELPHIPGVTPVFMSHLALRWSIGGLPFSGSNSREMGGWVRLRDTPEGPMTVAHLLALVDAWPPSVLPMLRQPAAGSTLTWTVEFMQPLPSQSSQAWCHYRVDTEYARDGYGHAAARLHSADGQLLALSRQTVTIFA